MILQQYKTERIAWSMHPHCSGVHSRSVLTSFTDHGNTLGPVQGISLPRSIQS